MIALPCGHLVCQPDFEKLGGFIGEKPSDKPSEDRRRANNNRNEGNGMDPAEFISGLSMMRMMGGVIGFPPGFMGDDDDDDDEEEEESDDESCPPLERVGGGPVEDDSDDDDSSMPPLEPIHGAPGNANNSDNDLMPPLENMRNVVENDNEEDSETSSMPALLPRDRAELDERRKRMILLEIALHWSAPTWTVVTMKRTTTALLLRAATTTHKLLLETLVKLIQAKKVRRMAWKFHFQCSNMSAVLRALPRRLLVTIILPCQSRNETSKLVELGL